jgi:hypothetical protein
MLCKSSLSSCITATVAYYGVGWHRRQRTRAVSRREWSLASFHATISGDLNDVRTLSEGVLNF